jgi:GT2 family glycosyltransferase
MVPGSQPPDQVVGKMTSSSPLVYTVILAHNHCEDTLQALDSFCQTTCPNHRLLLVDNHSSDGTAAAVQARYPQIDILAHSANLGFAAGMNSGLQYALRRGADLILMANNDVVVSPSMVTCLVEAMKPGVGAAAPMIYYWNDPQRIWSAGFSIHPWFLEMRGGARGKVDDGRWKSPFEVDCLLGCAVMLSSSMLRDVGLLDERYFFYYEDLDLSIRARRKGYRLITVPDAKMWHKVAGSAGMGSAFRVYHMTRGNVLLFRIHARGLQRPFGILVRVGSAVKKSAQFLLRGQSALFQSYWRGAHDGWRASLVRGDPVAPGG